MPERKCPWLDNHYCSRQAAALSVLEQEQNHPTYPSIDINQLINMVGSLPSEAAIDDEGQVMCTASGKISRQVNCSGYTKV